MARKKKPTHQPFESKTDHGKFTKICNDMMDGPAWAALNRSQRYLYLVFKSKYTAKVHDGVIISDNANDISIPTSEAKQMYTELRTFRSDVDRLIECGFIKLVQSGWNTRTANIYGFSDRWQQYGQASYEVPAAAKRPKRVFTDSSDHKRSLKTG